MSPLNIIKSSTDNKINTTLNMNIVIGTNRKLFTTNVKINIMVESPYNNGVTINDSLKKLVQNPPACGLS